MLPSNPVCPVCNYATSAVYCDLPSPEQLVNGVKPLDSLPAAWWNCMWNMVNCSVNQARGAVGSFITELNNVLAGAGICPNCVCTDQLYHAIDRIRQTIGNATVAGAVKSSSTPGMVSIDNNGFMTANCVGNATQLATSAHTLVGAVNELKTTYDTCFGSVSTALDGKAPTSHASSAATYGVGTASAYGHLRISGTYTSDLKDTGMAASQTALYNVYSYATQISAAAIGLGNVAGCSLGTASAGTATTAARSDHVHPLPAITSLSGTLDIAHGGTGQTTANAAANAFINSLGIGNDIPAGNDYYISQSVDGGTITTSYYRRPVSRLWEYIRGQANSVYAKSSHTHTKSQITDFPTSLKNPNALTVNGKTYDGSSAINAGVQTIANGGTGATTAACARTNLGLGSAATKTAGSTVGNVPLIGTALGTTANKIVLTNASGQLVPSSSTVGSAAYCAATAFRSCTWVPNMNNVTNATSAQVPVNDVTRKVIVANQITDVGFTSRAAIGLKRSNGGWGKLLLSVGCNDAGTVFYDYEFDAAGNVKATNFCGALRGLASCATCAATATKAICAGLISYFGDVVAARNMLMRTWSVSAEKGGALTSVPECDIVKAIYWATDNFLQGSYMTVTGYEGTGTGIYEIRKATNGVDIYGGTAGHACSWCTLYATCNRGRYLPLSFGGFY